MPLENFDVECTKMNKKSVTAPASGAVNIWTDGDNFKAAIGTSRSAEVVLAMKNTGQETYSVLVDKDIPLQLDDYFRNESNGRYMRISSLGTDAPDIATIPIRRLFGAYVDKLPD